MVYSVWTWKYFASFFIGQDLCSFETLPFAVEVQYLGNVVGNIYPGSVDDCIDKCKQIIECQNFVYSKNKQECYLKDGILTGSEPIRSWDQQFSVYKSCKIGIVDHPYKTIEAIQIILLHLNFQPIIQIF